MKHLTMKELEDLGFKIIKSEPCFDNNAVAQTRAKGYVRIETLYWLTGDGDTYQRTTIDPYLTKEQLTALSKALNKTI
jgi:hypothetical protein